jgi:MFS family permease
VDDLDGTGDHGDGGGPPGGSAAVILVTIWEVGEAAGPLLIAPLSELFGRRPVFLLAHVAFVLATALGAAAPSSALLVASRALTGAAVAANVLNPAVVGDMFAPAQRGSAMSCIMFAPLLASSLGPAFSSLVDAALGWRAVLWTSALLAALGQLLFLACFRETYPGALASKKAEKRSQGLGTAVLRPFVVFFGSGVLMVLSAYGALVFSYFYIIATTMPTVLEDVYSFEPGTTGPAFLANGESMPFCFFPLSGRTTGLMATPRVWHAHWCHHLPLVARPDLCAAGCREP